MSEIDYCKKMKLRPNLIKTEPILTKSSSNGKISGQYLSVNILIPNEQFIVHKMEALVVTKIIIYRI